MRVTRHYLTEGPMSFLDITGGVAAELLESGVDCGIAVISSRHTTAAILVQENERGLLRDLAAVLERTVPQTAQYSHNDLQGELPNGHAHCRAIFLPTSVVLPVSFGQLVLGRWQSILLVELDTSRPRDIDITIIPA